MVGSRPNGWWSDRPGAARRLYDRLLAQAADGSEIVLVLEGKARQGVPEQDGSVKVVHAGRDGDSAIVDLVAASEEPGSWTVVTADRGLRRQVEEHGAQVVGPKAVLDS